MERDPYELSEKVRDRMEHIGISDLTEKQFCILYLGVLHGDGRVLQPSRMSEMLHMANPTSLSATLKALCREGYLCKRMTKYVVTDSGMQATGGRAEWDWEFYHWIEDNYQRLPLRSDASSGLHARVYYLLARELGLCKIGFTSQKNLTHRIGSIRTGCPVDLELVAVEPGGLTLERERHKQFGHLRTRGEWFKFEGELESHVHQVAGNGESAQPQT